MPIHSFIQHYERMLKTSSTVGVERAFLECCYQTFPAFWDAVLIASGKKSLEDVKDRILKMDGEDYRRALAFTKSAKIEQDIDKALEKCRILLPLKKEPNIYLAFGFGSVGAGVLYDVLEESAIYFGLEFFGLDFFSNPETELLAKIPMWLAHEYCHIARLQREKEKKSLSLYKLKEKIVFEGLAVVFSELVYPGHPVGYYLGLSDKQIDWLKSYESDLWNEAIPLLERQSDGELHHYYFDSTPDGWMEDGTPAKRGYYLGYHLIQDALKHGDIKFHELIDYTFEQLWSISRR